MHQPTFTSSLHPNKSLLFIPILRNNLITPSFFEMSFTVNKLFHGKLTIISTAFLFKVTFFFSKIWSVFTVWLVWITSPQCFCSMTLKPWMNHFLKTSVTSSAVERFQIFTNPKNLKRYVMSHSLWVLERETRWNWNDNYASSTGRMF